MGLARCPFTVSFLGGEPPTKVDCRKQVGTLILTSLLEDLDRSLAISLLVRL